MGMSGKLKMGDRLICSPFDQLDGQTEHTNREKKRSSEGIPMRKLETYMQLRPGYLCLTPICREVGSPTDQNHRSVLHVLEIADAGMLLLFPLDRHAYDFEQSGFARRDAQTTSAT
jgi:hypothetical protein